MLYLSEIVDGWDYETESNLETRAVIYVKDTLLWTTAIKKRELPKVSKSKLGRMNDIS